MASTEILIQAVRAIHIVTCFDVAASTLFLWDYVLTFPLELDLVWRAKWSLMKILYIVQRYLPFVDTVGLVIIYQFKSDLGEKQCKELYFGSGAMIIVGMACSELILTVRAWAVWDQDRCLTIILPIAYFIFWVLEFALLADFLRSLEFANLPYPLAGCFVIHVNHYLILVWSIVLIWDVVILGLMMVPGIRAFKEGENLILTKVVYRDGALYYLYIFLLLTANIVIAKLLPPQYSQLLMSTARCVHSALTSRVLLNIRAHMYTSTTNPEDFANELESLNLQSQLPSNSSLTLVPMP